MRRYLQLIAFVAAAVILVGPAAQCQKPHPHEEQTNFSAEDDGVKRPVSIPSQVMTLLSGDERVREIMESENVAADKLPSSWFSASQIALGTAGSKDLIVVAEGPLLGANIVTFWVFIENDHEYKLALMTRAHDLDVERIRSRGYRNLKAMAATCCKVTTAKFRFDGNQYQKFTEKTEDIK